MHLLIHPYERFLQRYRKIAFGTSVLSFFGDFVTLLKCRFHRWYHTVAIPSHPYLPVISPHRQALWCTSSDSQPPFSLCINPLPYSVMAGIAWKRRPLNEQPPLSFNVRKVLSKADSLIRTYISTCTTLCAEVWVDRVDIALRDSLRWALANTCTASDTILANNVSHFE